VERNLSHRQFVIDDPKMLVKLAQTFNPISEKKYGHTVATFQGVRILIEGAVQVEMELLGNYAVFAYPGGHFLILVDEGFSRTLFDATKSKYLSP
jgi:hypothetical protein